MPIQNALWYTFTICETDQLTSAKKILDACGGTVNATLRQFIHRSSAIAIPADDRLATTIRGRKQIYPQEWHFQWKTWMRSFMLLPSGPNATLFAIMTYEPATKELKIYSAIRRVNDGPFALRLDNRQRQAILIAERQLSLRPVGLFEGIGTMSRQLSEKIDLL